MQIVDANIVLRYILRDHKEQSERAKKLIEENTVLIPIEVLCEVVYVLSGIYKISRAEISSKLTFLFAQTHCELPHRDAILRGLVLFSEKNLDMVDCILAAYNEIENAVVHTFDQRLQRLIKNK